MARLIVLNETDESGWQQARPLMLNSDQIRSVEQHPTVNGLSDTVSRITLVNPVTPKYDEAEHRTVYVEHFVFEKIAEIEALVNGATINTDYAQRKHRTGN